MLPPLPLLFRPSNCKPAPNRWTRLALVLIALAFLLLLTGCAIPCQPTADPARLARRIQIHPPPLTPWDLGIGINCEWRY